MLKAVLSHFYALADEARQKFGDNAPKVTDDIIEAAFPRTVEAATVEGCDRMLREGVMGAVKDLIRRPPADERQRTFNDIAPELMPLAEKLGSVAYYVPSASGPGRYMSVPDLCHDARALDAARQFMREKGEECLREAKRLDQLFEAVIRLGE